MIVFDTESDNLLDAATVIHVINLIDRETGERMAFHDHPEVSTTNRRGPLWHGIEYLADAVREGRMLAGHNVLKHDIPLIQKFFPDFRIPVDQMFDTLLLSQLIWTNLKDIDAGALKKGRRPKEFKDKRLSGRHSLEAWGYRFGMLKGDFSGPWDVFTEEMADYGIQDPEVTLKLVEHIEAQNYSEEAIRLEHRVADIIFKQERHGFYLDVPAAQRLEIELTAEKARLEDKLRAAFDPWFEPERKFGKVVIMEPKRSQRRKVEADGQLIIEERTTDAPFCKVKLVDFEPGSRDKIANRLKKVYGWVPTEFTDTGKPELNENTLGSLPYPEVKLLIRFLVTSKLLGTVALGKKAWLKRVDDDSRIRSPVKTNGAVTGRMTHADHMAQVPKIKLDEEGNILRGYEGKYGYESRSLFIAAPGKKLVGVDAEGLELRMLAHYMARYDGGAYVDTVVNGDKKLGTDVHSVNRKAIGIRTRDGAKTWMYAYLYGAGDLKLGMTFYEDMTEEWQDDFNRKHASTDERERALMRLGSKGRKRIETGLPALGDLQKAVKERAKKQKRIKGLDGRWLHIRAQHSALNTLLQGGGAIVMKKALVLAYDAFLERGWEHGREFAFVVNVHDEFQKEVLPDYAEDVGALAADAIRRAGEAFSLRCPLAGSSDIGRSWADTH